jgi:hypothetical protein
MAVVTYFWVPTQKMRKYKKIYIYISKNIWKKSKKNNKSEKRILECP